MNKSLPFYEIKDILAKSDDKDKVAELIIKFKNNELEGSDIMAIYNSGISDAHRISKAIINAKKENLDPNDLVYMSVYDKNHKGLKQELFKYFDVDFIEDNIQDWEAKEGKRKNMMEYYLRNKIRQIINNVNFK